MNNNQKPNEPIVVSPEIEEKPIMVIDARIEETAAILKPTLESLPSINDKKSPKEKKTKKPSISDSKMMIQKRLKTLKNGNLSMLTLRFKSIPSFKVNKDMLDRFQAINISKLTTIEEADRLEIEINDLLKYVDSLKLNPYLVSSETYPHLKKTTIGSLLIEWKGSLMTLNELNTTKEIDPSLKQDILKRQLIQWQNEARGLIDERLSYDTMRQEKLWLSKYKTISLKFSQWGLSLLFFSVLAVVLYFPQWDEYFLGLVSSSIMSKFTTIILIEIILFRGFTQWIRTIISTKPFRQLGKYRKMVSKTEQGLNDLAQMAQQFEKVSLKHLKKGKLLKATMLDFSILHYEKKRQEYERIFFASENPTFITKKPRLLIIYWIFFWVVLVDVFAFLFLSFT